MLEQRRAKEKGYITLREAAEISNYAPDYIGQLIRGGKIRGKQVYSNVAWVTTEEEIRSYMSKKTRCSDQTDDELERFEILGKRAFSIFLYVTIAILSLALLVVQYIFYVSFDKTMDDRIHTVALEF